MDRPIGITILSILQIVGGIVTLGTSLLVSSEAIAPLATLGITQIILYLSIFFLGGLLIASGVGMWLAKSWGWWLAVFYVVYSIMRYANALRLIPAVTAAYGAPTTGVETYTLGTAFVLLCISFYYSTFTKETC